MKKLTVLMIVSCALPSGALAGEVQKFQANTVQEFKAHEVEKFTAHEVPRQDARPVQPVPAAPAKPSCAIQPNARCAGARMERVDLHSAKLSGANLRGAHLRGARLDNADLSGANLEGADLSEASLGGADLSGANLKGARLGKAVLSGAEVVGTDFTGVDLNGANLSRAHIVGPSFRNADLRGAVLDDSQLADFTGAKTAGCRGCGPAGNGPQPTPRAAPAAQMDVTAFPVPKGWTLRKTTERSAFYLSPSQSCALTVWRPVSYQGPFPDVVSNFMARYADAMVRHGHQFATAEPIKPSRVFPGAYAYFRTMREGTEYRNGAFFVDLGGGIQKTFLICHDAREFPAAW